MTLEYWYVFPVAVVFAATAMASGVGGATFFAPFFIIGLGLPPEVAIGTGLITEVFGFASGVYAYSRRKLIDYRLGASLLVATVPAALAGAWVSGSIAPETLKVILGTGLFAVALSFLRTPKQAEVMRLDEAIDRDYGRARGETCLTPATGEPICYTVCNRLEGRTIAGVGGLFVGMISTGLGELNGYFLLRRCRVPSKVSVATSVFVVAVTALSAAAGHLAQFVRSGPEVLATVGSLILFTVPGVVVGAQLGSALASRISQHALEGAMGLLFLGVAALTLGEVLF